MAEINTIPNLKNPLIRIFQVISLERREIYAIYFFAILNGLIQLSLPLGIQAIINFVLAGSFSTSMTILIVLVVLGVLASGFIQVNQMKIIEKIQQQLFVRYSFEFAYRIPKLDVKAVDNYYLPELVNRFFDTVTLQKGLSKLLLDIPIASIQILFGMILLSFYNSVFIFFGIILFILLYLILRFTSPKGLEASLVESDYKYGVVGWMEEMARAIKSFKFSKGSTLHLDKTNTLVSGYLKSRTNHFNVLLVQYWTLIVFKVIITAAMLIVGGILLISQELNIGQFIAAEIVILSVLSAVEKFIVSLDNVYDVLTSVEKLGKVLDKPLEKEGMLELSPQSKGIKIEAKYLEFGFEKDKPILHGVNFKVDAGQTLCIMGVDGSGKSLLLRMITGAYTDFKGFLLVNDVPIGNYNLQSLRSHSGIFFSKQDIFYGTLFENIAMGNPSITTTNIMNLASEIGLKDFIHELPNGFDSILDPTGKRLSKTVISKILLLRAMISNPKLLLLEDPWQTLDYPYKDKITDYLIHKNKTTTTIITTNDFDFAAQCDLVLYLEDGRSQYFGTPSEVLPKISKK